MIKTEVMKEIKQLMELICDQRYHVDLKRNRSSFLYRGMPDRAFRLETSLKRNCKEKQGKIEHSILRNFSKYASTEDPNLQESVWRQLIVGQHHGLPTRLLDWSYSPLTALHFATSGEELKKMGEHDGVVWKIDIEELNRLLPTAYRNMLIDKSAYLFTVEMLKRLAPNLDRYDADMMEDAMVLLEPPSIDQRIVNQYSYFSVVPMGMNSIEEFLEKNTSGTVKYVIDKSLKWEIRDLLDQLNINERMMYPGLDGIAQWLKRHYYVEL